MPAALTPDEKQFSPQVPNYPALFKHMVLAIFTERKLPRTRPAQSRNKIPVQSSPNRSGLDPTKFDAAMDIALAQLKKYKMITEQSNRALIVLTAYGRETDAKHTREQASRIKTNKFDDYYKQLVVAGKDRVPKTAMPEQAKPSQSAAQRDDRVSGSTRVSDRQGAGSTRVGTANRTTPTTSKQG